MATPPPKAENHHHNYNEDTPNSPDSLSEVTNKEQSIKNDHMVKKAPGDDTPSLRLLGATIPEWDSGSNLPDFWAGSPYDKGFALPTASNVQFFNNPDYEHQIIVWKKAYFISLNCDLAD